MNEPSWFTFLNITHLLWNPELRLIRSLSKSGSVKLSEVDPVVDPVAMDEEDITAAAVETFGVPERK